MTVSRTIQGVCAAALAGGVLAMGCTEPLSTRTAAAPDKTSEARLVLSDSAPAAGSRVEVYAQISVVAPDIVGSYTARIRYDSTALAFDAEIPIADDALRATNAAVGLVRFAGASPSGLPSGRMAGYRFVVLRANGLQSLQLVVDELHTVARTDAARGLRAMPSRVEVSP